MVNKLELLATIEGDAQDSKQVVLEQVLEKIKQICKENQCALYVKQNSSSQEEKYPSYEGLI